MNKTAQHPQVLFREAINGKKSAPFLQDKEASARLSAPTNQPSTADKTALKQKQPKEHSVKRQTTFAGTWVYAHTDAYIHR